MRRLAIPFLLIAGLAGCGGDDEEDQTRSVTVNPNSTLKVSAEEYSFDPGAVTVRGAGPLTIRLRNDGELAHDLKVRRDGEDLGGTAVIEGGESADGRVNLEHGNYEMYCSVGDHEELGMRGELEVR